MHIFATMCGIAGIIGLDSEKAKPLIERMTGSMVHRGPDAGGIFVDEGVALGHRRLSIIDLNTGANQPFTDNSGEYVVVFNGEIYNFKELRDRLDYNFKTESDTEVLVAAFAIWGPKFVDTLNGMFAFAIYNNDSKELLLARDRLGVKPLYYYMKEQTFAFASELRTLLLSELVQPELDPDALKDYLRYGFVRSPRTIFKHIYQINPGDICTYKEGMFFKNAYWSLDKYKLKPNRLPYEDVVDTTAILLEESIKARMVADVPVGAFLSGGIDSSAVVALMAGMSEKPVETFSIVFDEPEFDESAYASMIAKKYRTNHTELRLKPSDLLDALPDYLKAMDHPTPDGINTYMVSKLVAATGIRVVLSGIGGDELFAGYPGFKHWKRFRWWGWIVEIPVFSHLVAALARLGPKPVFQKLAALFRGGNSALSGFYAANRAVNSHERMHALATLPKRDAKGWFNLDTLTIERYPAYSSYMVAELTHYTLDVLLKDTDQMSMAHALEVREPFFDYRLVDFLLPVQDRYKRKGRTPKSLLVEALGGKLPDELVHRPKKGFTFPWKLWLKTELKTYCSEALEALGKRPGFKQAGIDALWNDFLNDKPNTTWIQVWQLVILERWLQQVLGEAHVADAP